MRYVFIVGGVRALDVLLYSGGGVSDGEMGAIWNEDGKWVFVKDGACVACFFLVNLILLQGYLAHKKTHLPRTLQ